MTNSVLYILLHYITLHYITLYQITVQLVSVLKILSSSFKKRASCTRTYLVCCVVLYCIVNVLYQTTVVLEGNGSNLVDSASSHTLVSKIKPCTSKYKYITVKLRMAHYISSNLFDSPLLLGYP